MAPTGDDEGGAGQEFCLDNIEGDSECLTVKKEEKDNLYMNR
jgi:hypothetical protein